MKSNTVRFLLAAVLLFATAALLQARGSHEVFPPRLPLKAFPMQLGPFTGTGLVIPTEQLEVLGSGEFELRDYSANPGSGPAINLFLAYFPSQSTGDTIHSPKNCLPGAGWTPTESTRITLSFPGHAPIRANRYVLAKGESRALVLYWFWAHDRGVASEYWAKYYLVADSLRMRRSDGALVRFVTDIKPGESVSEAEQRVMPLANQVFPLLNSYIPR